MIQYRCVLLLVVFFSLFSVRVSAENRETSRWDASGSLQGYYPTSGVLNLWAGYNYLLWGSYEKNNEKIKEVERIQYGYIRPHLRLRTAVLLNGADFRLSVVPISFLKTLFGVGAYRLSMSPEKKHYDCHELECQDLIRDYYVEQFINWKLFSLYGAIKVRWDHVSAESQNAFVDPILQMPIHSAQEDVYQFNVDVSKKLTEQIISAVSYEYTMLASEGSHKNQYELALSYNTDSKYQLSYTLAGALTEYPGSNWDYKIGLRFDWKWQESYQL